MRADIQRSLQKKKKKKKKKHTGAHTRARGISRRNFYRVNCSQLTRGALFPQCIENNSASAMKKLGNTEPQLRH